MPMPTDRKSLYIIVTTLVVCLFLAGSVSARLAPNLERLVKKVSSAGSADSDSLLEVIVFLENDSQHDQMNKMATATRIGRDERIRTTISRLQNQKPSSSSSVEKFFDQHAVGSVKRHWIVPAYTVRLSLADIAVLSSMDGVKIIVENVALSFDAPIESTPAPMLAPAVSTELNLLNVPSLWKRGLTGKGRLVASFDTGVESTHPALASKWRGNTATLSASWFSKVSPGTNPVDIRGHGTHTMGIMVGSTPADTFGVAPDAEWISAGIIDQTGRPLSTTLSDIVDAYQWVLNPDGDINTTDDVPDVILNSWGIPRGLFSPCENAFADVITNVEAAGIVTIFAAGNEGPDASSLRSPADMSLTATTSFAVGAVDDSKLIGDFSSRGPASCDGSIKPEIVAPGVVIRSSYKGGGYYYMTGTSMAAPYIAGLVALMRQYNPDATVAEIKNALIMSAVDLGDPGEDNAYGYGLPDASKLTDYLPSPVASDLSLVSTNITGDGIALPGEQFELNLMLTNASGNITSADAVVTVSPGSGAVVLVDEASYFFGNGGTTATNINPFVLRFDDSLYHGQTVNGTVSVYQTNGSLEATMPFSLTVGVAPSGKVADYDNGRLKFTVSDFGQYGFAEGSIYDLRQTGLVFDSGENLLYEAGIIIGRNIVQISSSVRGEDGFFTPSDFVPVEDLKLSQDVATSATLFSSSFRDSHSSTPVPVVIEQETKMFNDFEDQSIILMTYTVHNEAPSRLTDISLGFVADFDLSDNADRVVYDSALDMVYQYTPGGTYVGLVALSGISGFSSMTNSSGKQGLNQQQKLDLITEHGVNVDESVVGDLMLLVGSGPLNIDPLSSADISFAVVVGYSLEDLTDAADRARVRFDLATEIASNEDGLLPGDFFLRQNYPNPFNPSTTISFDLPLAQEVSLDLFNVLGRKVKSLWTGRLPAGLHQFEWDATGENGQRVASGVYFYRLSSESVVRTKKMVLLK